MIKPKRMLTFYGKPKPELNSLVLDLMLVSDILQEVVVPATASASEN